MNKRVKIFIVVLMFFFCISINKAVSAAYIESVDNLDESRYPRI